ncbi:MAG: hypothetical protein M1127_01785 [Patescibacteria group bacterium]|nr:hypothetical protein [Patescibacteria group bacterium]
MEKIKSSVGKAPEQTKTPDIEKDYQNAIKELKDIYKSDSRLTDFLSRVLMFVRAGVLEDADVSKVTGFLCEDKTKKRLSEFLEKASPLAKKIVDFVWSNPAGFEKIERDIFNRDGAFTPVNEVLSYGVDEEKSFLHLHVPPCKTVQNKVSLLKEGLAEIAEVVQDNENIERITGTSWIVAQNPNLLRRLGFTIGGKEKTYKRLLRSSFLGNEKPVGSAFMERNDFLARYLKQRNNS